MARGLDHIVHAVRDLDAGADLYKRLGFAVGARNRHPWGTHNHIVQLPGFFIELVTVAEPGKLGDDGFSVLFARFNQSFLARREGLSMLLLESTDAAADAAAFKAAGIAAADGLTFEREGRRPDGSAVKVGFALAFARDAEAPETGFATCQQHYPENFWNPAFQRHPNTASRHRLRGAGRREPRRPSHLPVGLHRRAGPGVDLERRHRIDPARRHQGHGPGRLPQSVRRRAARCAGGRAACRRAVRRARASLLTAALNAGGIRHSAHMGRIVVAPQTAMGATLAFE